MFEVQTNYTIEDFAAYWRGFRWKAPGRKPPKQASRRGQKIAAWILVLAGGLVAAVGLWLGPRSEPLAVRMGGLAFVLGLVSALRRVPEYPYWVQRAWKNHQKQREDRTYRFTEQGIEIHTETSDHRYDYVHLQQLWEDEGHFYLFMGQQTPHILNKADFTQGAPSAFAPFLSEKTGHLVKWVNGDRPA